MPEYDRIRFYNILENYKVLHSLGKSVQTAHIWIQLIHSYSKIISLMDCALWRTTNTLSVRTHYSTWT